MCVLVFGMTRVTVWCNFVMFVISSLFITLFHQNQKGVGSPRAQSAVGGKPFRLSQNHLVLQLFDNIARRGGNFVAVRVVQRVQPGNAPRWGGGRRAAKPARRSAQIGQVALGGVEVARRVVVENRSGRHGTVRQWGRRAELRGGRVGGVGEVSNVKLKESKKENVSSAGLN